MIVVTAGTLEYADIIRAQRRFFTEAKVIHFVYDIGIDETRLGFGTHKSVDPADLAPTIGGHTLPPATFKTALMLEAMQLAEQNELVVWLDGDCLPLRDINPTIEMGGFDALVTLRPLAEIGQSCNPALDYLNSGVVMIRNTPSGQSFLHSWHEDSQCMNTDQGALNRCVVDYRHYAPEAHAIWKAVAAQIENTGYARSITCTWTSLIVPAMEWNCWHLPPTEATRILHFKRGIRSAAKDYINR